MKKIIRALRLRFRKIKAEAKKVGLSLPVLGLILLTFSTIITIAIAQRYRSTTLTRAELSTCKGAFYKGPSAQTNCTNACGECQECSRYRAGGYWECTGKDPDTGAISGLSSCKGNNFTYKSGCENGAGDLPGCGVGNCAKCSNDGGITVRWHCGTDINNDNELPIDPNNTNCKPMNCQAIALPPGLSKIKKPVYESKKSPEYFYKTTSGNCMGTAMSDTQLVEWCTNTDSTGTTCGSAKACGCNSSQYYSGTQTLTNTTLYFSSSSSCNNFVNGRQYTGAEVSKEKACNCPDTPPPTKESFQVNKDKCIKECPLNATSDTQCTFSAEATTGSRTGDYVVLDRSRFTSAQRNNCIEEFK